MSLKRSFAATGAALVVLLAGTAWAEGNERGEALFPLCAQCHGDQAEGNSDVGAPAIAGMAEWYVKAQLAKFRDGLRGRHFDDVMGMRMRPMALTLRSDEDVAAVSAQVAAMSKTSPEAELSGGDATNGKVLYTPCVACHGMDGGGNEALFGSPLANTSDWYLLKQLENFRAGVRGAAKGDQSGAMMRPMAMTLADEQAMKDVIAHIMTLSE